MRSARACSMLVPLRLAALRIAALAVGVEGAGQQVVDGDVLVGDRAGDAGEESGQPAARARRQIEAGDAAVFTVPDVMLTMRPKRAAHHRVDHLLDQLDRHRSCWR